MRGLVREGGGEASLRRVASSGGTPGSDTAGSSGIVVLKSYLANRFDVCMMGIVADGVGGSRGVLGITGYLRTDAASVGEIGAQSG